MRINAKALIALALLIGLLPTAGFALSPYSQNFDSLTQSDSAALSNVGWKVFANVFGPDWGYWYGYGAFPAPNGSGAFSNVGALDGGQQIVVFSDYNNANHNDGAHINSLVFQEQTVAAGDVGETWVFDFDGMHGDLAAASTAGAFIKTLNPAAGWAQTNYLTVDTTNIPASWGHYSISITIDASLVGQLLQFGFENWATLYQPSGMNYDNVWFHTNAPVPAEDASFGSVKALFR